MNDKCGRQTNKALTSRYIYTKGKLIRIYWADIKFSPCMHAWQNISTFIKISGSVINIFQYNKWSSSSCSKKNLWSWKQISRQIALWTIHYSIWIASHQTHMAWYHIFSRTIIAITWRVAAKIFIYPNANRFSECYVQKLFQNKRNNKDRNHTGEEKKNERKTQNSTSFTQPYQKSFTQLFLYICFSSIRRSAGYKCHS